MLVLQDHFSKYVVAYVVKDQTACTAAKTLRNRYFRLFGAPAYLISDQGKAFTGHIITHLCDLYGVQKLRTSPYYAQTNGQVERMNQMIIRMIGKLEEDKKACWSEHLPELLLAYNTTCSAVTGYSPYYLLFGRRSRIPVDYLFPTLRDSPHQTKMEVSVAAMQKRLKRPLQQLGTSPLKKLLNNAITMIAKLELLPYNLGTLLWFVLCGQAEGKGPMGRWRFHR